MIVNSLHEDVHPFLYASQAKYTKHLMKQKKFSDNHYREK